MTGQGSPVIVDLDATLDDVAPRVLRYLTARLGDVSLAEEIAQESLAALVRCWRNGAPPESADAFVFAVARRRLGRAVWRRRLFVPIELALGSRDASPSPEARAIARVEEGRVRSALAKLARRDREAILLVAVGEMSMAEASAVLGVSESAVKMRVSRARARLTALLEERHGTSATG